MKDKIKCPLTGSAENIEMIERVNVKDIKKIYRSKRDIDVSNEFDLEYVCLYRNDEINFSFFYPFVSGSEEFYSKLTSQKRYVEKKGEYQFSSNYISDGDSVLDVGCGVGWFRDYLGEVDYLGIEFSESSINECKNKGLKVTSTLIEEFAKSEEKFDVVCSFQVLEHVEKPYSFIKGMKDSCKDGGTIIISVPNVDSYMSTIENNYLNLPPHHVSWWSKEAMLYLARKLDLEFYDYNIEKINPKMMARNILKNRFNKILKRNRKLIRYNYFDRFVNKVFSFLGRLLGEIDGESLANGHTITFIFKKRSSND